jgi:2-amino-4-hydroxy-6-hydroxymethyldihydropteridine diphosphokinase
MAKAYLLLGGNLGDRLSMLSNAKKLIAKNIGQIVNESAIYETAPWGFKHHNNFYNQLVIVETTKNPHALLGLITETELNLGRVRGDATKYEEREIDIDILFYDHDVVNDKNLKIPHPYLHERKFALVPLMEVEAELVHPVLKKNVKKLLSECKDESEVKPLNLKKPL